MKTILDRIIGYIDPRAGAKRAQFRNVMHVLEDVGKRRYKGAGIGNRVDGWYTASTGPNTEIYGALVRLRNRSRDLVRNNPYAARAVQAIASNTVGAGIIPRPKNQALGELWNLWGDRTDCDTDNQKTFYAIQNLAMRTVVEAGEVLIRRRFRRASDGFAIPLQLQVLECDFLDHSRDRLLGGGAFIRQGVEFNAIGQRVAYWLFREHPGEYGLVNFAQESFRVPASEILHIYRIDRPGQIRGVPWGAPVLIKLKDFDDYEDAQLMRQKIAACFAAFVTDQEQPTNPEAIIDEKIEPGSIQILPPGREIHFGNPPTVGADYEPYTRVALRSIATGFGVTYESLTQDYSNVNFSSGRMGHLEFARNIDQWRWNMLIPGLCEPVWDWFVEAADLVGQVKPRADISASWTPPKREMIDPTKETEAEIKAIRGGLKTLSQSIREQGYDPDEVFEERNKENAEIDKYRLKLDSDPRNMTSTGIAQSSNNEDVSNEKDQNPNKQP